MLKRAGRKTRPFFVAGTFLAMILVGQGLKASLFTQGAGGPQGRGRCRFPIGGIFMTLRARAL